MRILYIGVHSHTGWGAEFWLNKAFNDIGIKTILLDYRNERKIKNIIELNNLIKEKSHSCDLIFIQRGDNLSPKIFKGVHLPLILWSTEPIQLKNDVDKLLSSKIFSWVFIHSYSCMDRVKNEFQYLQPISSVMHNATPKEKINFSNQKRNFSIFNRSLSFRRKVWLLLSKNNVKIIHGRFGDDYFNDLRDSQISINIHYSKKNLDDFESGIFEAMASGCVVISEVLNSKTMIDLDMNKAIIQVHSPWELYSKLKKIKKNPKIIYPYLIESKKVIKKNTWHERAKIMKNKFEEICD